MTRNFATALIIITTISSGALAAPLPNTTTCVGEPMSGRAYNHRVAGVDVDSGVGDGCFFAAYDRIGRRIEKTCHIGDLGLDERGQRCRIDAVITGNVIRRIIKIERMPAGK